MRIRLNAYAFTEQGIAMLSSILRSERAIDVNIRIMRAFVVMRRFVSDHAGLVQRVGAIELKQLETDKRIDTVFDALDRGKPTQTEIAKFNRQYKGLAVTYSDDFHDRFLIIDNVELHGLGSSINCLGRRVTSSGAILAARFAAMNSCAMLTSRLADTDRAVWCQPQLRRCVLLVM
jgi:hypothetical protein